ncbi:abc multidrug transporter [Hyphodiscus hymeniophilus]|uniref:Abc multidrug transporter n=1 Tax=Hyphodiscus hymeniophilus TaxID=353542 RepID=A0A9P6VDG6_9HELO|nr:abc multidrug transporter [Hyphodiscus hymeniophilus]
MSGVACFQRIQNSELDEKQEKQYNKETDIEIPIVRGSPDNYQVPSHCAIHVQDASISWSGVTEPLLSDLSFEIPKAGLTIVVGRTGVGKTSLLRALLGGLDISSGSIIMRQQKVMYCGQSLWFMKGTIRENIMGPLTFDPLWYDQVVHACSLSDDFSQLAAKDFTDVGNEGSALSGGQKQRVIMARAVYSRAPIVMLDNTLNGLDRKTESWVFKNLMGEGGLLRKGGVSVIMVSHNSTFRAKPRHHHMQRSDSR